MKFKIHFRSMIVEVNDLEELEETTYKTSIISKIEQLN